MTEAYNGHIDCTHLEDLKPKNNTTQRRERPVILTTENELSIDKHQVVRVKHCLTCRVRSYPALFLLLLGILVLQAAHTRHTGQAVETGDALT